MMAAIVLAVARACVPRDSGRPAAATRMKKIGNTAVNTVVYNAEMQGFETLSDEEISDVLNYVRNSWGNKGEAVRPEEVKALRK